MTENNAFRRTPPPLWAQFGAGIWIYGVIGPIVWAAEKLGIAQRLVAWPYARIRSALPRTNPFRNYEATGHDIFVASFPKSGTNWMLQLVLQLIFHGQCEYDHIHSIVPWPDPPAAPGYAIPLQNASVWMASPERKRVIKTHLDWKFLPYSPSARYICIIRDPKDVFVSSYRFFRGMFGPAVPSPDVWLRLFLSDRFPAGGSWAANVAGYWEQRKRRNVLIISFKAMKQDLRKVALDLADFLNLSVGENVLRDVCAQASFEHMKGIDEKFRLWRIIPWRAPAEMIRKGARGGSSELLSPPQRHQIDDYFSRELQKLGSDLPYSLFTN